MRYFFGFVFVLALVASPLSASAQDRGEGTTSEPTLQEPAQSAEPAPKEPALQLKLDEAGVDVAPEPPRTPDGYTLGKQELRVKRAKIALAVSAPVTAAGVVLLAYGLKNPKHVCLFGGCDPLSGGTGVTVPAASAYTIAGAVLLGAGAIGMLVSGGKLAVRKRELRELQETQSGKTRRVQWDLARSRFVF